MVNFLSIVYILDDILVKMPGIEIVNCGDEMENNVPITDIADLLFQQFVVISGKCIELYLILCTVPY